MKSTDTPSFFRRIAALLVAASASALISTPAQADDNGSRMSFFGSGTRVTGSGKLTSESRAVSGFQAIALRTSMKLMLRQGTREGIELRADDNILPLIETTVVDRSGVPTLEITAKKGTSFSTSNPVVATIDLVTLRALSISGSGDVVGDALKTPGLSVAISGRATKLGVSISGSGDVKARGLEADDVTVGIAGSGDADVTARKTLTVSIAGVGNVKYTGDATVKSSIAGRGNVSKQ